MNSTTQTYKNVIEDVIEKVQSEFINAGVDEAILNDLRTIWIRKLLATRALAHEQESATLGQDLPSTVVDRHPDDDLLIFPVAGIPLQASQPGSVNSVNSGNRYGRINQTDGDRSTGVERTATDSSINAAPSASATQENDDDLINSDLDSDDDEEPNIETSNRILCQFEKVTRTRNRWKCVLRDGVAKINGRDFVFQKAQGDFEF